VDAKLPELSSLSMDGYRKPNASIARPPVCTLNIAVDDIPQLVPPKQTAPDHATGKLTIALSGRENLGFGGCKATKIINFIHCKICQAPIEDNKHFLECHHPSQRMLLESLAMDLKKLQCASKSFARHVEISGIAQCFKQINYCLQRLATTLKIFNNTTSKG